MSKFRFIFNYMVYGDKKKDPDLHESGNSKKIINNEEVSKTKEKNKKGKK